MNLAIYLRSREGADLSGLAIHSDRGVQHRAFPYGQMLAEQAAVASASSRGDCSDIALAEAYYDHKRGQGTCRSAP